MAIKLGDLVTDLQGKDRMWTPETKSVSRSEDMNARHLKRQALISMIALSTIDPGACGKSTNGPSFHFLLPSLRYCRRQVSDNRDHRHWKYGPSSISSFRAGSFFIFIFTGALFGCWLLHLSSSSEFSVVYFWRNREQTHKRCPNDGFYFFFWQLVAVFAGFLSHGVWIRDKTGNSLPSISFSFEAHRKNNHANKTRSSTYSLSFAGRYRSLAVTGLLVMSLQGGPLCSMVPKEKYLAKVHQHSAKAGNI